MAKAANPDRGEFRLQVPIEEKAAWIEAATEERLSLAQWIRRVADAEIRRRKRRVR